MNDVLYQSICDFVARVLATHGKSVDKVDPKEASLLMHVSRRPIHVNTKPSVTVQKHNDLRKCLLLCFLCNQVAAPLVQAFHFPATAARVLGTTATLKELNYLRRLVNGLRPCQKLPHHCMKNKNDNVYFVCQA